MPVTSVLRIENLDEAPDMTENAVAPLAWVLAIFGSAAAYCLAVCFGKVKQCKVTAFPPTVDPICR